MKEISQNEVDDYIKMVINRYRPNSILWFERGLRLAFDYCNEQIRLHNLVNSSNPHVAKVMKCGDVNKPKSNDHPQSWFDAENKKLQLEQNQIFVEGMNAGSRKDIEDMFTKCDHQCENFTTLSDGTGYVCAKCGKWINYQND